MRQHSKIFTGFLFVTAVVASCAKSEFAGSNGSSGAKKNTTNGKPATATGTQEPGAVSIEGGGTVVPSNCIRGDFESKVYLICKGQKTKAESATFCGEQKMDLAHIDSEAENKYVVSTALAASSCTTWQETSYWVSNTRSTNVQTWPSGARIWHPKEPLNDGDDIQLMRYCDAPYGWNDLDAAVGAKFGWVCKSK